MTVDDSTLLDLCLALDPALSGSELVGAFLGTWHARYPGTHVDIRLLPSLQHASDTLVPGTEQCVLPGLGILQLTGLPASLTDTSRATLLRVLQHLGALLGAAEQRAAQQRDARLQAMLNHFAGMGCWLQRPDTDVLELDAGLRELAALPAERCSLADFLAQVEPADREELQLIMASFASAGRSETSDFSFRLCLPDGRSKRLAGQLVWLQDQAEPVMAGLIHDVTELELARTESLYRSELEHLLTTLSMRLITAPAEQFDSITQQALGEVGAYVGADRAYRFRYDFAAGTASNTHEWCAEGIAPEIENLQDTPVEAIDFWVSAHKKGLPLHLRRISDLPPEHGLRHILEPQGIQSIIALPLMDGTHCVGFIGFDAVRHERHWSDVDMTLLKLLARLLVSAERRFAHERALHDANRRLEEARLQAETLAHKANAASEAKSRFVATISHEIRTPLHAILGFADLLLQQQGAAQQQRECVQSIRESGETLLALINDVLDFSRIESEQLPLNAADFELRGFLQGITRMFEALARSKGLTLQLNVDPHCPQHICTDELRLRQLLNNIVGNAVKFTHSGGVHIDVRCHGIGEASPSLEFAVSDTGIGIAPEHLPRLYEAFFQADSGDDRVYAGTGLGLTIADMLVRMMNGSIAVQSVPGKGSTFTVRMPLSHCGRGLAPLSPSLAGKTDLRGLRILFAEDNSINRALVMLHLKDQGCEIVTAENGQKACELFAARPFDLVLMDCQMPVMDGYMATDTIRRLEQQRQSHTPIIAVTASAFQGEKEQCLAAGMDDVLTKPYSRQEFLAMIARWAPAQVNA